MAKPRPIEGLTAETTYADAARQVVDARAAELTEHAENVLDTADIERLHDARVATRRLRAALEIFEPCFPSKPFRRTLRDVKELADALGERRDHDVAIEALERFKFELSVPDRPGVDGLIESLRSEQEQANADLVPLVAAGGIQELERALGELR